GRAAQRLQVIRRRGEHQLYDDRSVGELEIAEAWGSPRVPHAAHVIAPDVVVEDDLVVPILMLLPRNRALWERRPEVEASDEVPPTPGGKAVLLPALEVDAREPGLVVPPTLTVRASVQALRPKVHRQERVVDVGAQRHHVGH